MSIESIQLSSPISPINPSTEITPFQQANDDENIPTPLPKANPSTPSLLVPQNDTTSTTTAAAAAPTTAATDTSAQKLFKFISGEIVYIKNTSQKLNEYTTQVDNKVQNASMKLESFRPAFEIPIKSSVEEDPAQAEENIEADLRKLKNSVRKLKLPTAASKFNIDYKALNKDLNLRFNDSTQGKLSFATSDIKEIIKVPNLYTNPLFEHSSAFQDLMARFQELPCIELKLCLLCFSVFPEGAIIKKRLMIYWWIGEGFVKEEGEKSAEEKGCEYFNKLIAEGFMEPVNEKRLQKVEVGSCKMDPLTRFGVIKLADRAKMFDFDANGNPKEDFSSSFRACLSGKGLVNIPNLDKLYMLFNVNENFLEFKQGWFSRMRNVNVVYLGRWKASGKHHIEVEDVQFLEELQHLKHLKFLSFQGVSTITELPESVSKLFNLVILDLRACHNLESVPHGIGALKNLTHFDMWECYLLDHMPKQLSSLENLQVLKGFVVRDSKAKTTSCTLEDLAKLTKLRKLSIHAKVNVFPQEQDLIALEKFNKLCKLTIAWGGGSNQARIEGKPMISSTQKAENRGDTTKTVTKPRPLARRLSRLPTRLGSFLSRDKTVESGIPLTLPKNLVKLDLQCYPEIFAPSWLKPGDLKSLRKLYIRGGKLRYLHIRHEGKVEDKWKVETLRLKYLCDLEMDWKELHKLFPDVIYLEKVKCPKVTLFPCNQFGVWTKKNNN
ncbi:hypothetical protein LguiA_014464 [Lonicera macranthoides]